MKKEAVHPRIKNVGEGVKTQSEVLKGLNTEQEKAVTFGPGPLLIIAGAGTGKTTVLTRRIVWLIEQGLALPEEILALTFMNKAAAEIEERVDLLMPLGYADINISTFHAFAQKILTQHALDIGLPGDFRMITETEAWMLVRKHLYDFDLDYYKPIGNPNKFIHALLKHFNKAKGEEISPEEYLNYAQGLQLDLDTQIKKKARKKSIKRQALSIKGVQTDPAEVSRIMEVANAYHKYQKLLLDNSFLDFGDSINYTLKLFRSRPRLLEFYQKQFKYILVDEFQDTDLSQYQLIKMLAAPQNNITVVGDDDQSIFKFRGASVSNILKFKEDYPKTYEITLTENYRSSQLILDQAYNFIQQNNPDRLEPKLKISKKLVSNKSEKSEIQVLHAKTSFEEARMVVDKILELQIAENLTWNDFAILGRANDHIEPFISELSKRGVPYIFVANKGLYRKPFILDLLAYLRLLDNYHLNENMFRVINFAKFKITDEELINYSQEAKRKALSIYEVMALHQSNEKVNELLRLLAKHAQISRNTTASELIVRVLEDLGLIKVLIEDTLENVENRAFVEKFYRKAQDFEEQNDDKSVRAFLNYIQMELEAGYQGELSQNEDSGPEAVKIMTVHSAKGLEYNCVFVVNMADQRFPSRQRGDPIEIPEALVREILPEGDAHLMEERRLFYVAQTRAKRFLYLTWADDYGGAVAKKPSRFLVELGLEEKSSKAPVGKVFFERSQPPKKIETTFKIPAAFSFSHIATFKHCPLEYKYKYIYQLPQPGEGKMSFGVTIHKTLEKYLTTMIQVNASSQPDLFGKRVDKLQIPNKALLFKFYKESWVDDWFRDKIEKEDYREKGLVLLENFYQRFLLDPKLPKFLEKYFKLKLGNYKFTGKIDRGDLNSDGTIDIIDYKTGARARSKIDTVDKKQLLIYQWAAEEEFHEQVTNLAYWDLINLNNPIPLEKGTPEDITALKEDILESIEKIVKTIKEDSFLELDKSTSHLQPCKFRQLE